MYFALYVINIACTSLPSDEEFLVGKLICFFPGLWLAPGLGKSVQLLFVKVAVIHFLLDCKQ